MLQAPLLLLATFGLYMLVLLVFGAITFRSCPEEAKALHEVCGSATATPFPPTPAADNGMQCKSLSLKLLCQRTSHAQPSIKMMNGA